MIISQKHTPQLTLPAIVLMLCLSCTGKKPDTAEPVIVATSHPIAATQGGAEAFSFISQPWRTSELSFRVSGQIDRLEAYAGNSYRRGSIIAEIDSRDFRLRKEKAEATLRQMEAEFRRVEMLYKKENIPASMYEKTRADYIAAKTTYNEAVNNLNDTRLIAPFDGYIGDVYVERYQDVRAAQPVLSLIDISQLKMEIYITQDVARLAKRGGEVSLIFDTEPEKTYKARIVEVGKSTMEDNLSYCLTAMLPNNDGHLIAGMSGKAYLQQSSSKAAGGVDIPLSALCHRPVDGDYVWTVDKTKSVVRKRKVESGQIQKDGMVRIVRGLSTDDLIATTGLRLLSDGMTVRLR
ncbi:MAG: efflux RND transporter periplasmic adaptor subunit [Prevotella sp.]